MNTLNLALIVAGPFAVIYAVIRVVGRFVLGPEPPAPTAVARGVRRRALPAAPVKPDVRHLPRPDRSTRALPAPARQLPAAPARTAGGAR